jgi:iron complex transport system ATP-binding protein
MEDSLILKVIDLYAGYGRNLVIEGVSFNVKRNEFIGLIGPNGVGKSTLFKTITGLLNPTKGKILYKGRDIKDYSRKDFAKEVAVLPQVFVPTFSFSIKDFVIWGRFPYFQRLKPPSERDLKMVSDVLRLLDITDIKNKKIDEISGGELQKVLIAQALAQEPEFLLLDEPTAHLDIGHQIEIMDILHRLNRDKKITIISVLHDLNLASQYCDKLILLNKGKIYKIGTPFEVLTYRIIEEVYKTVVIVKENPITSKPYVFLVSEEERKKV